MPRICDGAVINGQQQQVRHLACEGADGTWVPTARNQVRAVSATASPQAQPQPQTPAAAPGAISNDMVFKVQQRLRDLGFYVRDNIDGQWGPNTSAAVRNFQRSKGMNASGQPDSATLAALDIR